MLRGMKSMVIFVGALLMLTACALGPNEKTPQGAASVICEQLLDGEYDAILDRMYEWNPQQDEENFDITKWAEQVAAKNIRTILRAQIVSVFDDEQNPVVGYKVVDEQVAADAMSAKVMVQFIRQDDSMLEYQFTFLRQEDGTWRSMKMFR